MKKNDNTLHHNMGFLVLQEPQLKLNCESGLTLYSRQSFVYFFIPPFLKLIYSLILKQSDSILFNFTVTLQAGMMEERIV